VRLRLRFNFWRSIFVHRVLREQVIVYRVQRRDLEFEFKPQFLVGQFLWR
jgi:hypothetical protein